jgi:hypothetical protein
MRPEKPIISARQGYQCFLKFEKDLAARESKAEG